MRIEKDKADQYDVNNFSQQFEGIYLSNVSTVRGERQE